MLLASSKTSSIFWAVENDVSCAGMINKPKSLHYEFTNGWENSKSLGILNAAQEKWKPAVTLIWLKVEISSNTVLLFLNSGDVAAKNLLELTC